MTPPATPNVTQGSFQLQSLFETPVCKEHPFTDMIKALGFDIADLTEKHLICFSGMPMDMTDLIEEDHVTEFIEIASGALPCCVAWLEPLVFECANKQRRAASPAAVIATKRTRETMTSTETIGFYPKLTTAKLTKRRKVAPTGERDMADIRSYFLPC